MINTLNSKQFGCGPNSLFIQCMSNSISRQFCHILHRISKRNSVFIIMPPPPILTLTESTTSSQNMKKCKITRIMARKIPHLACFLNLEHWNNDHFFSWYENINLVIICQYLFRFSHIAVSIIDFQERKSLIANYIHVQICVYLIMI